MAPQHQARLEFILVQNLQLVAFYIYVYYFNGTVYVAVVKLYFVLFVLEMIWTSRWVFFKIFVPNKIILYKVMHYYAEVHEVGSRK